MSDTHAPSTSAADPKLAELFTDDPAVRRCPFDHFAAMRNHPGLYYHAEMDAYVVSRYADAVEVLRDANLFSSKLPFGRVTAKRERESLDSILKKRPELQSLVPALRPRRTPVLLNCDPPQHLRQRRLLQMPFSPQRIATGESWMRPLAHALIDTFAAGGAVDLVHSFCIPFPVEIIATLLGVSAERRADFKRWSDDFMRAAGNDGLTPEVLVTAMRGQVELFEYLRAEIEDRRANPRDDLISSVLNARQEGDEPFSVDEMLMMCSQFLVAGNETTTALIGSAVLTLAKRPALADQLRKRPELIPDFLTEVLRLEGPVQGVFRMATRDTTVGGFPLKAGEQVFIVHGAANRDPAAFGEDKELADAQPVGRHISFGLGEHFCIGSNLARLEAKIAVAALLERFAKIELADQRPLNYGATYMMRSLQKLPIVLEPAQ